jgi:hypothetical protein
MTRWVHGIHRDILRAAFREYFGVSEEHVDILVVLYGRPGEWTPLKRLQVLLDSHRPPKRQAIYERVRVLREAMEPESLLSGGQLSDEGYGLSEVGYAECAKALRALVEVLLRAGPKISVPAECSETVTPLSPVNCGTGLLASAIDELEAERPPAVLTRRKDAAA